MNSILENAVIPIRLGAKDFKLSEKEPERIISAIRNLYAGVLLLFKEKLARHSPKEYGEPPILLREKLEVKFELTPKGLKPKKVNKTIGIKLIEDRFKKLKIKVDWRRIHKLQELRNDIEHYKLQEGKEKIEEAIWLIFPVIQDFIRRYLDKESAELLGSETWQILLEAEETYQKELELCLKEINEKGYSVQ